MEQPKIMQDLEGRIKNLEGTIEELRKTNQTYREFIKTHIEPAIKSVVKYELSRLHELIEQGILKVPHSDKSTVTNLARVLIEDEFRKYLGGEWVPKHKDVLETPSEDIKTPEDALETL